MSYTKKDKIYQNQPVSSVILNNNFETRWKAFFKLLTQSWLALKIPS